MFERTQIIGNVGRHAELRYTPDGTPVTSFSVAVNRRWADANGQVQERTRWYRVVAWRRWAETCAKYVQKGMKVLVEGEVQATAWLDKTTNEPRAGLELTAQMVRFLGGGEHAEEELGPEIDAAPEAATGPNDESAF